MKYQEMKKSLKEKAIALREIKIGLREAQRVYHFNTYAGGRHVSMEDFHRYGGISPEQKEIHRKAYSDLLRCLNSYRAAKEDYRARHIAMSLFRGRKPEEIESNYRDNDYWDNDNHIFHPKSWNGNLKCKIDRYLQGLKRDNKYDEVPIVVNM